MHVLVTGSRGLAGSVLVAELREQGYEVVEFDISAGQDIRNLEAVRSAAQGCDAIIHLAALLGGPDDDPSDIMTVNLLGTWHTLLAAEEVGARRVVFFSSVNAMGVFMGQRAPDYLPIDDRHPCYPRGLYGLSKWRAEEMCRQFTARTGISTICLRPPAIFNDEVKRSIVTARRENTEFEWSPFWEYGAFLDVRDTAGAAVCALRCPDPGHVTVLVNAKDISSAVKSSRELVQMLHPDVPWKGGSEYEIDPYRSLVICDRAQRILGWSPNHTWRE